MPDSFVGWWAQRPGRVWHLVQSEITNRSVMRCGREMTLEATAGFLAFEPDPEGERCEQCVGRIVDD